MNSWASTALTACLSMAALTGACLTGCGNDGDGDGAAGASSSNRSESCDDGCLIDDVCVADGSSNPDNPCQICNAAASSDSWSDDDGASCDDGLFCTESDSCSAGACSGRARDCDDGLFCTGTETCNEATDSCEHEDVPCASASGCDDSTDACCMPAATEACNADGDVASYDSCGNEEEVVEDCVAAAAHGSCDSGVCGCQWGTVALACASCVVHVSTNGDDDSDGSSWGQAKLTVQAGIDAAVADSCAVWVAAGTHNPTAEPDGTTDEEALFTISLKEGVAVYGGFTGTETVFAERDWASNVTTLSGVLPSTTRVNTVVIGADDAVLDGFTVTGGNGSHGAGMYNEDVSPLVANCIFTGNTASTEGGGMANYAGAAPTVTNCTFSGNEADRGGGMVNDDSSPTLTDCTFSNNNATDDGGGMYNYDGAAPSLTNCTFSGNQAAPSGAGSGGGMANFNAAAPTLTDCSFADNEARDGGGMHNEESSPTLTDCTFSNNSAAENGGGMSNYDLSSPTVTNCSFSGNEAGWGAGLANTFGSSATLTNSSFSGNTATDYGGGMYTYDSAPVLTNCSFSGNTADEDGGGIYHEGVSSPVLKGCIVRDGVVNDTSTPTITYSNVEGGCPTGATCTAVISGDPLFVDAAGGDLHLSATSPCIDAADGDAAPTLDADGNARFDDPATTDSGVGAITYADMGAFEYQAAP